MLRRCCCERMCRGAYATIAGFLVFSMIQFRDGPFIRPHPAFWRVVLGVNLLYELALVFLLFQDLNSARSMMTYLDPNLGRPLPEKNYAENCAFTPQNVWVTVFFHFASVPFLDMSCAECHRHILFGTHIRLVWESFDLARLLVLLGKF
jgi:Phosphatidyl serine synthase